jgi:DNA damage-inducible protein 1
MIDKNYQTAQENFPEFFGNITMLYIDVEVNKTPIQAFVDSGAQSTIISEECAKRVNILHLLDTRFKGKAVGVGSANILGRVHLADMEVGGVILQCSFTVLEDNKVDLLFGLDNLKRH